MVNFKNYVENVVTRVEKYREAKCGTPEHTSIRSYIWKYNLEEVVENTYVINGYMIYETIENSYVVVKRNITKSGYVVTVKNLRSGRSFVEIVALGNERQNVYEVEGIIDDYEDDSDYIVYFEPKTFSYDRLTREYTY